MTLSTGSINISFTISTIVNTIIFHFYYYYG